MQKSISKKDNLLVLSGGMDSVTMLYEYREQIGMAVTFDYGSNHAEKEIACAKLHAERLGIPHIIIPLSFIKYYFLLFSSLYFSELFC